MPHVVSLILFLMSLGSMSHVDFKKCPCRRVEFRGRGPLLPSSNGKSVRWIQAYRVTIICQVFYIIYSTSHEMKPVESFYYRGY